MGGDTGKMISVFGGSLLYVFRTGAMFYRFFLFSTLGEYSRFWDGRLRDKQVELANTKITGFGKYKNLYT
jgi:hypothetical protein